MPRKAKEKNEELNIKTENKTVAKKKSSTRSKATCSLKSTSEKTTKNTSKNTTKSTRKNPSKSTTKKSTAKTTSRKKSLASTKLSTVEYYDLPFRYNETVVKILAQTPNVLFIYWDIADNDRKLYEEQFGKDFFEKTRPVLIITNSTMNYNFEVEINDFANSWYLHINDAACDYNVELGRRFITNSNNSQDSSNIQTFYFNDYIYVASSNKLEAPNDHILFDKLGQSVFFRNVKTNFVQEKEISSLSYLQNIGRIYNIYDLYKEIYKDELNESELGLNLSSSSSSTFK